MISRPLRVAALCALLHLGCLAKQEPEPGTAQPAARPQPAQSSSPAENPEKPADGVQSGQEAPPLSLPSIPGGQTWTLPVPTAGDAGVPDAKTGEHRAWLVAFMASWCGYCAESLPTLRELESRFPELRVVVVTIDETPAGRREEAEKVAAAGLEAPVLRADPATRTTWLGATGSVPRYVFIDSTGRIVAQDRGFGDKVRPMMVDQAMRALRGAPKARPAL